MTRTTRIPLSLLALALVLALVLLTLPLRAHALTVTVVGGSGTGPEITSAQEDTKTAIESTISAIADVAQRASLAALVIDKYVLEPLAFVVSGNLLKSITSGVISFVIGKTNGTGAPQFVQNLRGNLQSVGDTQALAFIAQFSQNSNSPFRSAIASSLRTNYLQQTSLAGFFAANQCTLNQVSPNINQYLAGNWSQGGWTAWFALATQSRNNPYLEYQNANEELTSLATDAQAAQLAQLNWGRGFLSWCGAASPSGTGVVGTAPGDACTQADGSPGSIQTPGSVIQDELNTALGSTIGKLVNMGNISPEINQILGDIGNVMNTVNFATNLLGGSSGGLASAGTSFGGNPSFLAQYQSSPYIGATQSTVFQSSATLPQAGSDLLVRVNEFQTAWNTIGGAANNASSNLINLQNFCSAQAQLAQTQADSTSDPEFQATLLAFVNTANSETQAAQSANTNEVGPVLSQFQNAENIISAAQALIAKVESELSAGTGNTADLAALQTTPPTESDVANADQQALSFGQASANPAGSLNVSGSTLLDQMNLLSANAQSAKSVCTIPTAPSSSSASNFSV